MIFDELAQSPFIQNGGPLLIFLIIVVWFLAKEPLDKLWEWIKRRLSPPDRNFYFTTLRKGKEP